HIRRDDKVSLARSDTRAAPSVHVPRSSDRDPVAPDPATGDIACQRCGSPLEREQILAGHSLKPSVPSPLPATKHKIESGSLLFALSHPLSGSLPESIPATQTPPQISCSLMLRKQLRRLDGQYNGNVCAVRKRQRLEDSAAVVLISVVDQCQDCRALKLSVYQNIDGGGCCAVTTHSDTPSNIFGARGSSHSSC